ncbi:MAG: S-layer homology domain-containing protein [Firmicutes bacterium]|nr:S-layer homology domain-containing protein [Bacillota bacterium]
MAKAKKHPHKMLIVPLLAILLAVGLWTSGIVFAAVSVPPPAPDSTGVWHVATNDDLHYAMEHAKPGQTVYLFTTQNLTIDDNPSIITVGYGVTLNIGGTATITIKSAAGGNGNVIHVNSGGILIVDSIISTTNSSIYNEGYAYLHSGKVEGNEKWLGGGSITTFTILISYLPGVNDGSVTMPNPATQTGDVPAGQSITVSALAAPTRPGYTFTGWLGFVLNSNGTPDHTTDHLYQPGDQVTTNSLYMNMVAQWQQNEDQVVHYTVHYFYGGTEDETLTENLNVWAGDPTVSAVPDKPKTGYKDGAPKFVPSLPMTVAEGDAINVYYVKDDTQVVHYSVHYIYDGTEDETLAENLTVWAGNPTVTAITERPKAGYKAAVPHYNRDLPATVTEGDALNVYYVSDNSQVVHYSVHYIYDGREDETLTENLTVWAGDPTVTAITEQPKTGYTADTPHYNRDLPATVAEGDALNVYYVRSDAYTVTYNANGDNIGGTVVSDTNSPYLPGDPVTVLGNTGNLTKANYNFAGWNTKADGTGTSYMPGATFSMPANDVILYAQWTPTGGGGGGGGGGSGGSGGSNTPSKPSTGGDANILAIPADNTGTPPVALNKSDHIAYILGYPDGKIHPGANISRAEVATIFFRLFTDGSRKANWSASNSYGDVSSSNWYNNSVSTLSKARILNGYPDGTFHPNASITRAEFAAMAARFASGSPTTAITFSDLNGNWATDEIYRAAGLGWINGYPDGTFRPNQNITRAEAMSIVNRVLNRRVTSTDDLLSQMARWSDNSNVTAWYYFEVQEATNSHTYHRKADGVSEKWTSIMANPDWSALEQPGYRP